MTSRRIAFRRIADATAARAQLIVLRWLPGGRREGSEYVRGIRRATIRGSAPSKLTSAPAPGPTLRPVIAAAI